MPEIIRNAIAIVSTFTVIATFTIIFLQLVLCATGQYNGLSSKQERIIVYTGIAVALLLIPFYYLPA